jgi:predicted nucleic acid-binding protein
MDTGAFVALLNQDDALHEEAKKFYQTLPATVRRATTQAVVSECYTLFRYRFGTSTAYRWLDYLEKARSANHIRLLYNDERDGQRAEEFLRRFDDQALSYTDALTLAAAERYKARAIFGFDHHLALTGFPLLPGRRVRQ